MSLPVLALSPSPYILLSLELSLTNSLVYCHRFSLFFSQTALAGQFPLLITIRHLLFNKKMKSAPKTKVSSPGYPEGRFLFQILDPSLSCNCRSQHFRALIIHVAPNLENVFIHCAGSHAYRSCNKSFLYIPVGSYTYFFYSIMCS